MQTILGSGGAIGIELAKYLKDYTPDIRLVSRNPVKVNETDQLHPADILDRDQLLKAVEGSKVIYVTVGFPYNHKVWAENWPPLIDRLIEYCKTNGSKLVFFDNIYMYDPDHLDGMTETTPINPSSKKGRVRAQIAGKITTEMSKGRLQALIARSADFYGPSIKNTSILTETVIKPLSQGKKARWIGGLHFKHSFTYTPDAGKATALLGNTDSAYGQVWHLPTASPALTGKEWIDKIASLLNTTPKYSTVSKFMLRLLGLFMPTLGESAEMFYQYDRDYVFDSRKFEQEFNFSPTSYDTGINQIIEADYRSPKTTF